MPNGIKGSRFGDLTDITYDGVISDSGYLLGGVGQLVDGVKGHDNYKINKGFEWVGWRKTNETLDIVFEFQNLRNFTTTTINCQNSFTKEVRVFSSAMIWFSIDNIKWSNIPIKFSYQSDNTLERPRGLKSFDLYLLS
jgi:discoidin domain receptor family protein 2